MAIPNKPPKSPYEYDPTRAQKPGQFQIPTDATVDAGWGTQMPQITPQRVAETKTVNPFTMGSDARRTVSQPMQSLLDLVTETASAVGTLGNVVKKYETDNHNRLLKKDRKSLLAKQKELQNIYNREWDGTGSRQDFENKKYEDTLTIYNDLENTMTTQENRGEVGTTIAKLKSNKNNIDFDIWQDGLRTIQLEADNKGLSIKDQNKMVQAYIEEGAKTFRGRDDWSEVSTTLLTASQIKLDRLFDIQLDNWGQEQLPVLMAEMGPDALEKNYKGDSTAENPNGYDYESYRIKLESILRATLPAEFNSERLQPKIDAYIDKVLSNHMGQIRSQHTIQAKNNRIISNNEMLDQSIKNMDVTPEAVGENLDITKDISTENGNTAAESVNLLKDTATKTINSLIKKARENPDISLTDAIKVISSIDEGTNEKVWLNAFKKQYIENFPNKPTEDNEGNPTKHYSDYINNQMLTLETNVKDQINQATSKITTQKASD
jgi:hypothetical protein